MLSKEVKSEKYITDKFTTKQKIKEFIENMNKKEFEKAKSVRKEIEENVVFLNANIEKYVNNDMFYTVKFKIKTKIEKTKTEEDGFVKSRDIKSKFKTKRFLDLVDIDYDDVRYNVVYIERSFNSKADLDDYEQKVICKLKEAVDKARDILNKQEKVEKEKIIY